MFALIGMCVLLLAGCSDDSEPTSAPPSDDGFSRVKYIRDYRYLDYTFFDVGKQGVHFEEGESIEDFRLYISSIPSDTTTVAGTAHVIPWDTMQYYDERECTTWVEIDRSYYVVNEDIFLLDMLTWGIPPSRALACWMKISEQGGEVREIGDVDSDTLQLMLLKGSSPLPTDFTVQYEWRNVYSLGYLYAEPEQVRIRVCRGPAGDEANPANPDGQDGTPFVELLGVDRYDEAYNPNPDGWVDVMDGAVYSSYRSLVIFPSRRPFESTILDVTVPELYYHTYSGLRMDSTKYYLEVGLADN